MLLNLDNTCLRNSLGSGKVAYLMNNTCQTFLVFLFFYLLMSFLWLVSSDDWPWLYCLLVSYSCWLVWREVASKIIQWFRCLLRSSKEYHGVLFALWWDGQLHSIWWCYIYLQSLRHFRETFLIVDKCHTVRQNLKIFSFPLDNTEDSADAALPVERSQTAVLLIRREILSWRTW